MASDNVEIFGYVLQYGAAFIACCAAYYTATKANKAANGAVLASKAANEISTQTLNIEIAKERIKIREKRILLLVEKFADFSSISALKQMKSAEALAEEDFSKLSNTLSQILLLLDPKDPDFKALAMRMSFETALGFDSVDENEHMPLDDRTFLKICQSILSREYEKLDKLLLLEKKYNAKNK